MSHITHGNVFADLGFDPNEAQNLMIRADLMCALTTFIECQKMTQTQAAKFLGIPQPKISYIINGRIDKCSIDFLVKLLATAGKQITVRVESTRSRRKAGQAAKQRRVLIRKAPTETS